MSSPRYFLFVLFLLLSVNVFPQSEIIGAVFSKKTGIALPHATAMLMDEKLSTSANEKGVFKLVSVKNNPNDTLLIRWIGYLPVKIPVNKISGVLNVSLEDDVKTLSEVSISSKGKAKLLGDYGTSGAGSYACDGGVNARRFERPEMYHFLKDVIVWRSPDYFGSNTKTRFRIKVYDLDPATGGPGESLCLDTIEVTDLDNAVIKIDVSKYSISIPGQYFFVAIEHLNIPYNERYRLLRLGKIEEGIPELPAYYEVLYAPSLYTILDRKADSWYLQPQPGAMWKRVSRAISIKVTVM